VHVVITIALLDINEKETVSILIRSTAKLSFVLFMLAFVASALHYYVKNRFTNWLLANRRYIGVSFAVSHYIHLAMLILMTLHIDFNVFEDRGIAKTAVGATAYAFITLMTITSFDKTRNLFGASNWKRIHTIGGYLLWVIFAKSYLLEMTSPLRIFLATVAVVVLVLRVLVLIKKK
jgi:sulfoxide reductase heme-binding subunit YedZ